MTADISECVSNVKWAQNVFSQMPILKCFDPVCWILLKNPMSNFSLLHCGFSTDIPICYLAHFCLHWELNASKYIFSYDHNLFAADTCL